MNILESMNAQLLNSFVNDEHMQKMKRIRDNCLYYEDSHEENDYNARIQVCHWDNRPCTMQCMKRSNE